MSIKDLRDGDHCFGQFLVADSRKCVSGKGKNYLSITLQDSTGTIDAKKWDVFPEDEETIVRGNIVEVQGEVLLYQKSLQMKVLSCAKVAADNIDWSRFLLSSPVSEKELEAKLNTYIESIGNKKLQELVKKVISNSEGKYLSWPGAVRNHHDFVSGLLYHSITMTDVAAKVCSVYKSLNRDVVIAGTLIHDIGKTVELSSPQACQFTLEGKLLGHVSIGFALVYDAAHEVGMHDFDNLPEKEKTPDSPLYKDKELALIMEHIMLSHHGKAEFGSPVLPVTRESLIVSMIDDMDAKMMILDKAYSTIANGETTARLFNMDDRYFYKPTYASDSHAPSGTSLEEEKEDLAK